MTEKFTMQDTTAAISPTLALQRYVEHVCAIRDELGVQVHLAVSADPKTNGWMIQARVKPPVRITATEAPDGTWLVTAIRYRQSHTVSSTGVAPADLLAAIDSAVTEFTALHPH